MELLLSRLSITACVGLCQNVCRSDCAFFFSRVIPVVVVPCFVVVTVGLLVATSD